MVSKKVLVTGAAGFIGYHVSAELLKEGCEVIGIDSLNKYYDIDLKISRKQELLKNTNFKFFQLDLSDRLNVEELFRNEKFEYVIHLAAQAGVRYSITNPHAYISSNIDAFLNILEGCRHHEIKHLVYASSSSVYGGNETMPFSVHHNVDHPISLYAATKKSNELMAHTYSHLYNIPTTGLRFFTVYGPYGRPDMALFLFTKAIVEGKAIDIYNEGKMKRDFTYIDDIVNGIVRVMRKIPEGNPQWDKSQPDSSSSWAPYKIFNIGNNKPVELMEFIETIEEALGKKAEKNFLPMQAGDVPATYADVQDLVDAVDFKPSTSLKHGIQKFVDWYIDYYKVKI